MTDPRTRATQPSQRGRPNVPSQGNNRHATGQHALPVTAARAGNDPRTPEPRLPPQLMFRAGQLVRLLTDVNQEFRAGQIVKITGYMALPKSDTVREGQSTQWTETDADTLYKFEKRVLVPRRVQIDSYNFERSISHKQLARQRGGQPDMSGERYPEGSVVYTLVDIEFPYGPTPRDTITVPKGTRCWVKAHTTRKAGEAGSKKYATPMPNFIGRFWYCLQAQVRVWHWVTVPCKNAKEAGNFVALTSHEVRAYNLDNPEAVPAPQVEDWE